MNQERILITDKKQMLGLRILGIVVIIGSIIFCILTIQENGRIAAERDNCIRCKATVIEIITSRHNDEGVSLNYRVKVSYTVNDETYENKVTISNNQIKKGDTVDVWYYPNDPSKLAENPDSWNRVEPIVNSIIAALIGLIFIVISLFSADGNFIKFAGIPIKAINH